MDRVVGEIEQLLGEKRYYDHRIAMSDIELALHEPGAVVRLGLTDPIRVALRRSLEVLSLSVAALVYIVVFLVPWLLVVTLLWWIVVAMRRRLRAGQGP